MALPPVFKHILQTLAVWLVGAALWVGMAQGAAQAQGIEVSRLQANRQDGALTLDFAVRLALPRTVEEALYRGVPVYFVAQATLTRYRWYWRDERVARVARSWRLAYQPLTSTWRVGLGGLNQAYPTLSEALSAVSSIPGWRLVDLPQLDPDSRYAIEFSYRLDTTQLPSPMQIGLGGQAEWDIGIERLLRLDP